MNLIRIGVDMLQAELTTRRVLGGQQQLRNRHTELLRLVAESADKRAFTELFNHYGPMLKGFMMRKGADGDTAEDLAQEAMLQVWRKAHLFDPSKGAVSTWIFTLARNLRIDSLRRASNYQYEELVGFDVEDESPIGDETLIRKQDSRLVNQAIAQLPEEQKTVIELSYLNDLTQSEIAEKLNQPLGTVKSRMRLAYQKLGRTLEGLK